MSPSKMRKTPAYSDGHMARHIGNARDSNPHLMGSNYERRDAWWLGWDDADAELKEAEPTPVEAVLAITAEQVRARREKTGASMTRCKAELEKEALEAAVDLAETEDDIRLILRKLVERIHVPAY